MAIRGDEAKVAKIPEMWEVDIKDVECSRDESGLIGKGGFATVYLGKWRRIPVALKVINDQPVFIILWNSKMKFKFGTRQHLHTFSHFMVSLIKVARRSLFRPTWKTEMLGHT
ncbi:hypothetical protein M427DRAFT_447053 [Gonapodya prolifera JEL478]|uniref:Protein kinase domain-containing protein n=1 Tax=Gonapodya prolifera (strain JEL478) TaxID=1344416 RepID=A0A139A2S7_GONPJ|nr:hypothetical protein M427DRAFT_447053 [Gonapodya prolifera JEL478]|eukprot:KXS11087.1 hypothetical protein M427DRAFT_447053 [Gonapodya prolifera JEL478]